MASAQWLAASSEVWVLAADHQELTTDFLLLYYIADRKQFPGSEAQQREQLLAKIAEAGRADVDYIQLREKDLCSRELEALATAY